MGDSPQSKEQESCQHPYDSVMTGKVDAYIEGSNRPLNRETVDICTDCKSVVGVEGKDSVLITVGRGNNGCDHKFEDVEDTTVVAQFPRKGITIAETTIPVCTECDYPADEAEIPL